MCTEVCTKCLTCYLVQIQQKRDENTYDLFTPCFIILTSRMFFWSWEQWLKTNKQTKQIHRFSTLIVNYKFASKALYEWTWFIDREMVCLELFSNLDSCLQTGAITWSTPVFETLCHRQHGWYLADMTNICNALSWSRICVFLLKCHWKLLSWVKLMKTLHWFRYGFAPKTLQHHNDVIMGSMASQITSLTIYPNRLFRRRSKKKSKLRVTGLCDGRWIPRTKGQ